MFLFRCLAIVLAACSPALAQRLIAVDSNRSLYDLNLQTGAKTLITTVGPLGNSLAYDYQHGFLYMASTALYRVDIETGATTQVGSFGNPLINLQGLEYDGSTDTLYGISAHDFGLYTINRNSGAATLVGSTGGTFASSLGHDWINNVMYATSATTDRLYSVNRTTGGTTLVGALLASGNSQGLAFRPDNQTMYLADQGTLYSVNLGTGAATLIGSTGPGSLVGLTFIPRPDAQSANKTIVPADHHFQEGAVSTPYPFGSNLSRRVMYAYAGTVADYGKPMSLVAIELRPEGGTGAAVAGTYNFSLDCSTGAPNLSPTALDAVFNNNHGADRIRTFTGTLNVPAPVVGQTPNAFGLRIPFSRPFEWDPRCGPLVLDFVYNSGTPAFGSWDAIGSPYVVGGRYANSAVATTATNMLSGAPVLQIVHSFDQLQITNPHYFTSGPLYEGSLTYVHTYEGSLMPWTGRRSITSLALRRPNGAPFPGATYQIRIRMSSIASNTNFNGYGLDLTTVFTGTLDAPPSPASQDPDHFDLHIALQQPFSFDTSAQLAIGIEALGPATGPGATSPAGDMDRVSGQIGGPARYYYGPSWWISGGGAFWFAFGIEGLPAVTIPSALATTTNTVGASGSGSPFHSGQCRALNMISAVDAGITTPTFIRHLRFRPPGAVLAVDPTTYTCTIDLSNPTNTPATISTTFDNNHGPNRTRVFDGQFSVPYITRAVTDTEFPCQVKLQRPFLWDPAVSPYLSVDFRILSVAGPGFHIETTATLTGLSNARVTATGNANATTGNVGQVAIAMQFGGEESNGLSTPYGAGCLGTNGVPRSTTRGLCTLPNPGFGIGVRNARGLAPAFLVIGFGQQTVPLAGAPGCNLLTTLEVGTWGLVLTDIGGEGMMPFPFPNENAFHGVTFNTQWLVYDPSANPLGLAASDALRHQLAFF